MRRAVVPLAGAGLLVAVAALRLPPPGALLRPSATPFDRSKDPGAGPTLVLLTAVAPLVPPGASVAVRASSGSAEETAYCTLLAASLLPGRDVQAAEAPVEAGKPEYVIVVGANAARQDFGRLLFESPQGAVWRRTGA